MAEQSQESNLYAPPQARVDDVHAEGEQDLADRSTRLAAAIVDGLIYMALYFVIVLLVMGIRFMELGTASMGKQVLLQFVGVGIYLGLNGYWLAKNGQSIAKKLLNIKIVRSDGSAAGLPRIVGLRLLPMWVLAMVPFIGPLVVTLVDPLMIFRESRKCLHDTIADTIVIKA
jgi:uncharacterized RDD family membrane protein YckC